MQNGPKAIPPPGTSFGSFARRHVPIFFSQSGRAQAELQGGVSMTNLRALVGACFLLAVMGFDVFVPLGWALVLVAASTVTP